MGDSDEVVNNLSQSRRSKQAVLVLLFSKDVYNVSSLSFISDFAGEVLISTYGCFRLLHVGIYYRQGLLIVIYLSLYTVCALFARK